MSVCCEQPQGRSDRPAPRVTKHHASAPHHVVGRDDRLSQDAGMLVPFEGRTERTKRRRFRLCRHQAHDSFSGRVQRIPGCRCQALLAPGTSNSCFGRFCHADLPRPSGRNGIHCPTSWSAPLVHPAARPPIFPTPGPRKPMFLFPTGQPGQFTQQLEKRMCIECCLLRHLRDDLCRRHHPTMRAPFPEQEDGLQQSRTPTTLPAR